MLFHPMLNFLMLFNLFLLNNIQQLLALKILFVQPKFSHFNSHFGFGLSLAKLLANDEHDVHILAPIKEESDKHMATEVGTVTIHYFKAPKALQIELGVKLTRDNTFIEILNDMELMGKLKSEKFDVGIAEAFMMTEYSLAIFHFLGIPKTIATHTQPLSPVQLYLLGVLTKIKEGNRLVSVGEPTMNMKPFGEERLKIIGTRVGDHRAAQLKQRGQEIWDHSTQQTLRKIKQHIVEEDPLYQQIADQKYGGLIFPGFAELFKRARFFLINSQPELDFTQFDIVKQIEKVKFIGGFNLKPIPTPEINFPMDLDAYDEGVVLISFGTNVNTTRPEYLTIMEAISETIKKFHKFLFIWKVSEGHANQSFISDMTNVISTGWVRQKEILAHPKTVAFVSHCGMNSVLEGIYYGVPMVCVPFFGDQYYNSESLARQHIGLVVDREQDKDTLRQQLSVALAKALGQKHVMLMEQSHAIAVDHPEDQIDFEKLQRVSSALRQKNIAKTISDAIKVVQDELLSEN